jgi:hypothetical protein
MKTTRIMLFALILLGALAGTGSAATSVSVGIHTGSYGRTSVDIGFFYDDLAPYGRWIERPRYGWVWIPVHVASSWRPYEYGRWVWTEDGWTWISDEPYGWATYHYGRWYDDPDYGWEWIPGDEWAPAWVSWQEADDYVGWAPLPPYVDYRPGVTLNVRLAADDYFFVPYDRFLSTRVYDYAVPYSDCERIYRRSRNVTRYDWRNDAIYNPGVSFDRVQRFAGRVPRYQVANLAWDQRHRGARIENNRVALFRPQVQRTRVAAPPDRPVARRSVLSAAAAEQTFRNRRQDRQLRQQQAQGAFQGQRGQRFETRQNRQVTRQQISRQQQQQQWQQQRAQRQQPRFERQQQQQQRWQQERAQRQSRVERQQQWQQERAQRQPRFERQQQQQQWRQQQQERAQRQPRFERQQQWQQERAQQRQQQQQWRQQQQQERAQRQPRFERQQQWQQERAMRQQQQQQWRQQRQQERAQRQPRFERQQQRGPQRQQQDRPQRGNGNPHRQRPPQ